MTDPTFFIPEVQRTLILINAVAAEVARGARVESQSDYQAVVVRGKRPNHVLHLLLSLVTVGLWIPVWIVLAIVKHEKRTVIRVDQCGNVQRA